MPSTGSSVARLDLWMCETHRIEPMGHDGCEAAGEPAYRYTGWAYRRQHVRGSRGERVWVGGLTLVSIEFQRYESLVYALDERGRFYSISYEDWFAEKAQVA